MTISNDIYELGNCQTCEHKAHNHGFGSCFGSLICLCEKFAAWGYEESQFLLILKENKK